MHSQPFFFNMRERDREHKQGDGQRDRERAASSPLSGEPDVGLDPRTPGS